MTNKTNTASHIKLALGVIWIAAKLGCHAIHVVEIWAAKLHIELTSVVAAFEYVHRADVGLLIAAILTVDLVAHVVNLLYKAAGTAAAKLWKR